MRNFNFDNVDEVSGGYSQPGTIAVFTVDGVEFGTSDNGKDYMEVNFKENPSTSLKHRFYMSEGALPRVQSLYKAAVGNKLEGQNVSEAMIIAGLQGKQIALKVTAKINDGKVYSDLPFGGFCKPAAQISELAFTAKEAGELEDAKLVARNAAAAAPGTAAGPAPTAGAAAQPTGQADDF